MAILTATEEDFHGMHIFPLRGDGQIMSEIFYAKKIFRCSLLSPFPIYYRVSPEKPFPEINSTRHHSFPLFKFTKKDLTPKLTTLHLENCTFHQIYTSLNSRQFQPSFSR